MEISINRQDFLIVTVGSLASPPQNKRLLAVNRSHYCNAVLQNYVSRIKNQCQCFHSDVVYYPRIVPACLSSFLLLVEDSFCTDCMSARRKDSRIYHDMPLKTYKLLGQTFSKDIKCKLRF